jgi:exopolysaccharide biosynthesis polyprenyl glycosylphosphotransferase
MGTTETDGTTLARYAAAPLDLLLAIVAVGLANRFLAGLWGGSTSTPWLAFCVVIFLQLLIGTILRLYARWNGWGSFLPRSIATVALAAVIGELSFAWGHFGVRWQLSATVAVFWVLSVLGRAALMQSRRLFRSKPYNVDYVVLVGEPEATAQARQELQLWDGPRVRVVAAFTAAEATDKLIAYVTHNPADMVIYLSPMKEVREVKKLLAAVLELGLRIGLPPESEIERLVSTSEVARTSRGYATLPVVVVSSVWQSPSYLMAKRVIDLVLSAIALLVLSPLYLAIGLLVKFTSPGPIFYRWEVLGKNRKPFVGYKFRTMVLNADEIKKDLMKFNEMSGAAFKMRNDPRITRVGRVLRKFSLDEIPQFYSVLKGDMSLVGPRPPNKAEADQFELWQHRKLSVKPGVTCLWQIKGRSEISDFAEWAQLDLEYIRNASILVDLKILALTVPRVVFAVGAY